jgi:hypothetical protein
MLVTDQWRWLFSVVITGLTSCVLVAWFVSQRHVFKGPNINVEMLFAARGETTTLEGRRYLDGVAVDAKNEKGNEKGDGETVRRKTASVLVQD